MTEDESDRKRAAALELLRRQRARGSLVEYARSVDIPGVPASPDPNAELFKPIETALALHHRVILEAIERTVSRPMGRLMILAPPGSAKSSYASVVTPAYLLSKHAGYRIILASYAAQIAEKHSRKCRALVRSPAHASIFGPNAALEKDQKAVHQWALKHNSEFMAAGLLAGITGNRANGIIIDDPVSGREQADSPTIRDKTEQEYIDSVTTRLLPGGWIILINTRWHEDDLSGRLLPEDYKGQTGPVLCRDGQTWEVLNIPAKAEHADDPLGREHGAYLWPEWFPESHWAQWEQNPRATRTWASLYQQRPTAGDGLEFKREWFKWYDPDIEPGEPGGPPQYYTPYGATDNATLEDKGDFTEHGVFGIDPDSHFWLLDWWFAQKTTDVTIAAFVEMVRKHHPYKWWNEGGPIDHAISPATSKALREAHLHVTRESLPSIRNKAIKCASFQARAAQGMVHLPLKRPWATRLVDQLCGFPAAKYDDGVDVCGLIGRGIATMMQPYIARPPEPKKGLVPFTAAWLESTGEDETMKPRYS